MEFKHIEYFIEACKHKSFSKAAGSLFISQQALSRCISNLENELSCTLFTRTISGIELTAEGTFLRDRFGPIVSSYYETAGDVVTYLKKQPVRLPFCCAPGVIRSISPELIIAFGEQHPEIALDMIELPDKQCERYIQEDKRHFGLMLHRAWSGRAKFGSIVVKTEPSYLLVHKDHPFASRPGVSLSQLKNERVLTLDKTSYQQDDLNRAVEPFHFSIKPFYESSDVSQLCALVDRGKGVLVSIRQIYEESGLSNVVLVPLEERTVDYRIAFVYQDDGALETAARTFIQFIIDNIRTYDAVIPSETEGKDPAACR